MATTQKQRDAVLRENAIKQHMHLSTSGDIDDVMRTGSGSSSYPVVDDEGNERFIEIVVEIPTGSGGEPYDGYAAHDAYMSELAVKEQEKAEREAEKAKKIARDEANRAAKKAAKEAAKGE